MRQAFVLRADAGLPLVRRSEAAAGPSNDGGLEFRHGLEHVGPKAALLFPCARHKTNLVDPDLAFGLCTYAERGVVTRPIRLKTEVVLSPVRGGSANCFFSLLPIVAKQANDHPIGRFSLEPYGSLIRFAGTNAKIFLLQSTSLVAGCNLLTDSTV